MLLSILHLCVDFRYQCLLPASLQNANSSGVKKEGKSIHPFVVPSSSWTCLYDQFYQDRLSDNVDGKVQRHACFPCYKWYNGRIAITMHSITKKTRSIHWESWHCQNLLGRCLQNRNCSAYLQRIAPWTLIGDASWDMKLCTLLSTMCL